MALILVLTLLAAAMLAPGLVVGPSLDAAVFNHVGGRLLDGVAPYVGTWDHKPPGIYLVLAGVQAMLGWLGPWIADWLLSVAATVGVGLAVAAVLARLGIAGWVRALAAAGVVALAGTYLLALGGGLTEPVATVPVAAALVLALRPAGRAAPALAGVLIGLSLLLSPQVVPGVAVTITLALGLQPVGLRVAGAARLAMGVLLPIAAVAAWLLLTGALPAALDAILGYSEAYRAASAGYGATLGVPVAAWTSLVSLFLVAPALLGAASLAKAPQPMRGVALACLLWIGGSLVFFVAQGRFYAHYAIPLAVPLGILAGLGLARVSESLRRVGRPHKVVVALPLVVIVLVSVAAGVVSGAMQAAPVAEQSERMQAVAARLRDLPAGTLLVWGNEPRLYDLAGRAPASRYAYFYPLTTPAYSTAAMVEEVVSGLAAHPPVVVVDAGSPGPGRPGFLPLLIDRTVLTDGRDLDLLDPLRAFVADRYELTATVAGWPIYVLRGAANP